MARPANHEVKTAWDEYQKLNKEKKELEQRLGQFKSQMTQEQSRMRGAKYCRSTLEPWLQRKAEIEKDRERCVERKTAVEQRMNAIRGLAMQGKAAFDSQILDANGQLLQLCLVELRAIRELLSSR